MRAFRAKMWVMTRLYSIARIRGPGFDTRIVIVVDILGSVLQAQSKQIAGEGLQKDRLRTVEVKMAAGKHSNLTCPHGHFPPGR